ncbi:MAG: hypothetical protein VKO21_07195, partial [Candidatus Sericytochromatia bacterium]|nr:hypothetical protein [Candidatus Sericytochromatia bacterium]
MRSSGRKGLLAASSVALLVACAQVAEVAGSTDEGGVHLALAPGKAAVNLPVDLAYPGLPGEAITLHYQVVGDEGASKGQLPQSVRAEAGSRIVVSEGQRLQLYLEGGKWATQLVDVTVPPGVTTLAPFRWSPAATLEGRLVVSGEPVDFTGVQVRPDNMPRLGWSNAAGAFRMTGLPSVPIRIRAMGRGLEGSQDWRPDDQASARFEIRLVPARIDLERVEPAFGLAGDQVRLFFAGSPAAEVSVHFTGADLAKAWRGADGSWRAVVPKGARSGPVRLLQRGLAGNAVTWHRLAELRFVNVPRVVAREGSWQPEVEAVSDDGRSWPSQDAVMSMQRLSTGLFDLLVAEARLGSMKATASVVLDEATIRRVAPLPPGVVPYALAVAPDGGWLVADHPGRRVLHRPPAGDWSILP